MTHKQCIICLLAMGNWDFTVAEYFLLKFKNSF